MNFFFDLLLTWNPWTNFLSEILLLQIFFIYNLYLFYCSKNLFFASVYFLIFFFFCGFFLCYFNIEFLSGFLLVIELTVFFIFLIFFFFLNSSGNFFNKRLIHFNFFLIFNSFFFFCYFFFFSYLNFLNIYFFWDNFFESNYFLVFNDIHGFFLNYYVFNGIFFFFFGFLMFLATLICIKILKLCKEPSFKSISNTLTFFNFFKDLISFDFIRKQNLVYQHSRKPVNYMVLKSLKEWSKKEVK